MVQRIIAPALDAILGQDIKVLDHGFVRVIDYMGTDSSIVQAARVSYGDGTKTIRQDESLIAYLMRNSHTSPFEMCEIKLHIKLPIFVARQWIRHRTANVNEYSARYSLAKDDFYVPDIDQIAKQATDNKQGRGEPLTSEAAQRTRDTITRTSESCYQAYSAMLAEDVARELARIVLPVNFYTEWYWKIDLNNFMRFLRLRLDPHAQYEIRQYAAVLHDMMKLWVPITHEAFNAFNGRSVQNAPS